MKPKRTRWASSTRRAAAEAAEQPVPVEHLGPGADHVRDVGAVEPLALHDEGLLPDHLLGRDEPDRHAEHDVVEPRGANHSSSTSATPLPERKIRSKKWSPR